MLGFFLNSHTKHQQNRKAYRAIKIWKTKNQQTHTERSKANTTQASAERAFTHTRPNKTNKGSESWRDFLVDNKVKDNKANACVDDADGAKTANSQHTHTHTHAKIFDLRFVISVLWLIYSCVCMCLFIFLHECCCRRTGKPKSHANLPHYRFRPLCCTVHVLSWVCLSLIRYWFWHSLIIFVH